MGDVHVSIIDPDGNNLGSWVTTAEGEHVQDFADLTFDMVSQINRARATRWHPGFPDDDTWSIADWSNAMCGEAGEAANVVKKIRRYEEGLHGVGDPTEQELRKMLAHELADVFLYLDLLASKAGVDLPAAIVEKFNIVSDRQGFSEKL